MSLRLKGFSYLEMIIAVAILAIATAVAVPLAISMYNDDKSEIINIANIRNGTETSIKRVIRNGEVIEEGEDVDLSQYKILDVRYENGVFIYEVE